MKIKEKHIKVSDEAHDILKKMAKEFGTSMSELATAVIKELGDYHFEGKVEVEGLTIKLSR